MTSTETPPRRVFASERAARKDRVLTWITLGVAAVICVVIGVGAYAMSNSWWTEEAPVASADQQLPDGQSRFDRAGQDFFTRQGRATIDLGSPASAAELGLPAGGATRVDTLVPVSLDIRGSGADIAFRGVSSFTLATSDDALSRVDVVPAASGSWATMSGDLEARAAEWGWTEAQLAALDEEVGAAGRNAGVASTVSLPPTTYAGMDITADVSVSAGGSLALVYVLSR